LNVYICRTKEFQKKVKRVLINCKDKNTEYMNLSYWEKDVYFDKIDVVIIGSGIVGLTAALRLKQKESKLKIVVLERGLFPDGASNRNAGFACFGSPSELLEDLQTHTEEINEIKGMVFIRFK